MAGHASRWVWVVLLVLSACGRSHSKDDPALGGQPATGGSTSNSGSAGDGDSLGGAVPSVGGNVSSGGNVSGGAPSTAQGGNVEAGASSGGTASGGSNTGGADTGGSSTGGANSGGSLSEGGSAGTAPIEYETCCYVGGNIRVFVTKFDPETRLCINVSFIQSVPTHPLGIPTTISMPEGFLFERARATYLEPDKTCTRQGFTNDSRDVTTATGWISWDKMFNCYESGVRGELVFTFDGIEEAQTLTFDDAEARCST